MPKVRIQFLFPIEEIEDIIEEIGFIIYIQRIPYWLFDKFSLGKCILKENISIVLRNAKNPIYSFIFYKCFSKAL